MNRARSAERRTGVGSRIVAPPRLIALARHVPGGSHRDDLTSDGGGVEIGASTWQIELPFTAHIAIVALGMIPAGIATSRLSHPASLSTGVSIVDVATLLVSRTEDRAWVVEPFETSVGLGLTVGPILGRLVGQISWRIPFLVCGAFMVAALAGSPTRRTDPAHGPGPGSVGTARA